MTVDDGYYFVIDEALNYLDASEELYVHETYYRMLVRGANEFMEPSQRKQQGWVLCCCAGTSSIEEMIEGPSSVSESPVERLP